jgi:hypothetical protein
VSPSPSPSVSPKPSPSASVVALPDTGSGVAGGLDLSSGWMLLVGAAGLLGLVGVSLRKRSV